ncbi:MAG: choice-of-anchor L domain-containing protein, partial [Methylococcaceae bacterium]|nr:choice-of-anchor L domain-containing protein [Methylococcaceae bacterium]
PPWVAIQSFFGHPCLRLHLPFSQGNGWTSTSLLTTMPVAPLIRFRFTAPLNVTGVTASFVYASEEFPEFSGTQFADGFAFARSETLDGVKQDVNYAILPNGNPVSLLDQSTNIHFMANGKPNDPNVPHVADLEFDGLTRILTVKAPVTPGAAEDFTLIVADTGDGIYDSAVFVSALSFFNDPGFHFTIGTVTTQDNPEFKEFSATVPLPNAAWFFLTGLIGILAKKRATNAI